MANKKISVLPVASAISNSDVVPVVQGGVTRKLGLGQAGTNYVPYANAIGNVLVGTVSDNGYRVNVSGSISVSEALRSIVASGSDTAITAGVGSLATGNRGFWWQLSANNHADLWGGNTAANAWVQKLRVTTDGNVLVGTTVDNSTGKLQVAGNVSPSAHNTYDLGTTAVRWKDLWLQTGAFNGSDARLKTEVKPFSTKEINAAKQLSREIGLYQWLDSIATKGADKARHHVGMTVQKAIEIMEANGLDPFAYGFIGYDQWDDRIVHHEAVKASEEEKDKDGKVVKEEVKAKAAFDEVVLKAGDAFSFRYDQLNLFIARGIEARLTALEEAN